MGQDRREAERAGGDAGSRTVDNLDPAKTPVVPAMVGRADPDVIKSQYYPTNRNVLLQKGGVSEKVKSFVDDEAERAARSLASEPDPRQAARDRRATCRATSSTRPTRSRSSRSRRPSRPRPGVKGLGFEAVGRPSFYDTWLAKR